MMHLIIGTDGAARAEARRRLWRGPLEELRPAISAEELAALAGTPTLTGEPQAFFVQFAFTADQEGEGEDTDDRQGELCRIAEGLADSVHLFIFEEEKLAAKLVERLKKSGAKAEALPVPEKKEAFNVFALADALGRRDRKKLWLLLTDALRSGIAPENIAGVLAWKARTLLAGAQGARERDALHRLSRELVAMYHDSHRGAGDLGLLLERFSLRL